MAKQKRFSGKFNDNSTFVLVINVSLYSREASDGFGITECGSLACLANPCRNGGTCEEKLHQSHDLENDINTAILDGGMADFENRWKCKCPTGYLGPSCEVSVCSNNPCQYGGTCVEFPGSGYICLCPLGKHGHFCEHSEYADESNEVLKLTLSFV